jgi:hypothetical protein
MEEVVVGAEVYYLVYRSSGTDLRQKQGGLSGRFAVEYSWPVRRFQKHLARTMGNQRPYQAGGPDLESLYLRS